LKYLISTVKKTIAVSINRIPKIVNGNKKKLIKPAKIIVKPIYLIKYLTRNSPRRLDNEEAIFEVGLIYVFRFFELTNIIIESTQKNRLFVRD
jgi:hypothetical protein